MANALVDALNKPDDLDTGGIQTTEIGSGAVLGPNISGGAVLASHLTSGCVLGPNISGAVVTKLHVISGNILGPHISGGVLTTDHMGANIVTPAKQKFVGTGSPTGWGLGVQTGQYVTGGGSTVTIAFPTTYLAVPEVLVSAGASTAGGGTAGWHRVVVAGTGSVVIESQNASASGTWLAIGSASIT